MINDTGYTIIITQVDNNEWRAACVETVAHGELPGGYGSIFTGSSPWGVYRAVIENYHLCRELRESQQK